LRIRLIEVGRTDRGFVAEGFQHYAERIKRSLPFEEVVVAEAGRGDAGHQRQVEGERLLATLRSGERVVVLDERGVGLTSMEFSKRLGTWRDQGTRQVAFVIGGAYGLSDPVRQRADLVLALSPMTFPHQLVRVLFAEQLYRALTILQGGPYHH
jgi:23S rRNA (pseudouridine1915-N3)-methyltransferase